MCSEHLYFPGGFNNEGLKLWLDSKNPLSYNGTGDLWYDLSGFNNHGIIKSGVTFSNQNGGSFVFSGTGEVIIPSILSSYPFTASSLVTHDGNWELYGSPTINNIFSMSIGGQRVTLCVTTATYWGLPAGIFTAYGGTSHWLSTTRPTNKGPNDWSSVSWRIYGANNHRINLNNISISSSNLGAYHGGFPGWAIGGNSPANTHDEYWRGKISEIVIFGRILSETEMNILSARHATQSRTESNTHLFNCSAEQVAYHELIGIGRESQTDFILSTMYTSGGLGFKSGLDGASFLSTDKQYILAAHNNETLDFEPYGRGNRLKRVWYIQKTGIIEGNIQVFFNTTFIPSGFQYKVIYSPLIDFSESSIVIATSPIINGSSIEYQIDSSSIQKGYYSLFSSEKSITNNKVSPRNVFHLVLLFHVFWF